ncbi:Uncharacterised protein [Legionella pneumophila subsp. pascullei]|uniref:Uncharacterized protein n=1 Tax=Legionella pneumophila subsp. pascullei TaxID=91890 RepID=A0AAX2IZI1_LEGPN|nr:Uncharacterised protein [Legionella pneumophila subsp. pascullei]VEH08306.1 Uncharacterised protein [Legionella pneumophila subsp. pascullei]
MAPVAIIAQIGTTTPTTWRKAILIRTMTKIMTAEAIPVPFYLILSPLDGSFPAIDSFLSGFG